MTFHEHSVAAPFRGTLRAAAVLISLAACAGRLAAEDDLQLREEEAMKAAVQRVAPSVVSIETVGGLERLGQVLFGTGPTTGLVVSDDGYIISSAFNFAQKPASILVGLPDGTRTPARLVATDHNRMLVLLKVEVEDPLAVPEAVPEKEMLVGQWSIAVGRTFDGSQPNMSVGIVSALNRIWGKAIQTDAKVSPSNYGGPLVDIRGRVLGVLVPLAPNKADEVTGVEWYDSGIGFAVPLEHIQRYLPKLREGHDLYPGMMGVSLSGHDIYSEPAVIVACRPNSPAYKAGLKSGDKIVEMDGQAIDRQAQLLHEVNRRYAGDTVRVAVLRGQERIEREIELIDKLEPYQRPFLGILPERVPAGPAGGVAVRYVYPDSAAAGAGLQPGDRIVSLDGKAVQHRDELAERVGILDLGRLARLGVRRGDQTLNVELNPAAEPEAVPAELPPVKSVADAPGAEGQGAERPPAGTFAIKVPEFPNDCLVHVPEGYDPRLQYGVVVWLHAPGGFRDDELVARWKDHCERDKLILLAPKSADPAKWQKLDGQFARKALDQLRAAYRVDPLRIVAHGHEGGGALAYVLAFGHRDLVRGVAAIDAPLGGLPPENDPVYRLDFYVTTATKSKFAGQIPAAIQLLRDRKYAVTVREQGEEGRYLNDDELAELLRWIDSLDRI